jgi:hypothetical protein
MSTRTPMQTLLLVVGVVILLGGLVCVVAGFADFGGSDPESDGGGALALFAAGGFAMVIGFGIVAFTRAAMLGGGGYTRVTVEQGSAPRTGRFCSACGAAQSPSARFCESCGAAVR